MHFGGTYAQLQLLCASPCSFGLACSSSVCCQSGCVGLTAPYNCNETDKTWKTVCRVRRRTVTFLAFAKIAPTCNTFEHRPTVQAKLNDYTRIRSCKFISGHAAAS
jgi:hypothetical protein